MNQKFERFVGIDWSGKKGRSQSGIQIAEFGLEALHPKIVRPRSGVNWSRSAAVEYVRSLTDRPTLIGIDFAFSVPLPTPARLIGDVRQLWALVESLCQDEENFYAGPIWLSPNSPFRSLFRYQNFKGADFNGKRLRETERRAKPCATSIYKLMYSQVGRGSFAGMRVLNHLSPVINNGIAVWPFDNLRSKQTVIMEVYPSAFYPMADGRRPDPKKQTSAAVADLIRQVLRRFGVTSDEDIPKTQDGIDAYVTSAALAHLSKEQSNFVVPPYFREVASQEGWIFGVPFGNVP